MKRAYRPLSIRERRARAEDEAFFDMPYGRARLDVMCWLGVNGLRRIPLDAVCQQARHWLDERGLTQ